MKVNIYKIAAFIFRNHPPARDWGAGLLVSWLAWHLNQQTCCLVLDDDENIQGVGIARTVMKPEDGARNGMLTTAYDPEGSVVWVDLTVTTHPIALKILVLKIKERFGARDTIAYLRRNDRKIISRPYTAFRDAVLNRELIRHG